jgi:hypothetical protein
MTTAARSPSTLEILLFITAAIGIVLAIVVSLVLVVAGSWP